MVPYFYAALRRYEAAGWLRKTVGLVGGKDLPAEPSEEDFRLGLRSGIILCNVLNKVQPGAVAKVWINLVPTLPLFRLFYMFYLFIDWFDKDNCLFVLRWLKDLATPLLFRMEQLYQHFSTLKTSEISLWLWRNWGFQPLKPLIWNRLVLRVQLWLCTCRYFFFFHVTFIHILSLQGGKSASARIVNCVLALKSYSDWKQGGGSGSWKFVGNLKPPICGKPFLRKNSEPFMNSFPRTSSWGERSQDSFSSEDPNEAVSEIF